ncbi:MAG: hypothetical protein EOP49_02935 [Sphingobacteriales bacterium]|nr:MAG: hypothetical protein EOP49_02935 [Sphingobacteriales bacterium]
MIRKLAFFLFVLLCQQAKAQNFYSGSEFGISFGGSQYFGDLNDERGFRFIRPAFGGFARYHLNPYISARANVLFTRVGYNDKFSSNVYNQRRNLNFQSNVYELSLQAEFNFFRFSTGEIGNRWTPYLTGGIGAFYYDPFSEFDGKKYFLRPLGTEGQNAGFNERKYSKVSLCFPVGAGFKYWIRPGLNFGFEITNRLTLTDYLDDVSTNYIGANAFPTDPLNPNPAYILQDRSIEIDPAAPLGRPGKQRGNSSTKDQYMMFLFHLSFQLKVYKCPAYMNGDLIGY